MKAILGKKMGMTQIFDEDGNVIPVTVIEAGPEVVTQVKTVETDGYNAVQVGFEDQKPQRVNKPLTGHFEKAGVAPKKHLALLQMNCPVLKPVRCCSPVLCCSGCPHKKHRIHHNSRCFLLDYYSLSG